MNKTCHSKPFIVIRQIDAGQKECICLLVQTSLSLRILTDGKSSGEMGEMIKLSTACARQKLQVFIDEDIVFIEDTYVMSLTKRD